MAEHWRFAFEGETYDGKDLLLDDYAFLVEKSGLSLYALWRPLQDPKAAKYVVAFMHARKLNANFDDVFAEIKIPFDEFVESYELYRDEPKDEEEADPVDPPVAVAS